MGRAGEAYYAYDDLGRLSAVVDDAGNTAIYNYDAVGNLLGIDRFTPGAGGIGVYAVLPGKAAVGNQVKIQGYGFDPTPANNTVTFNGTSASVVSSTAYAIVATVPASATTGTVSVTNTNGSANSPQAFTVLGAPTITTFPNSVVTSYGYDNACRLPTIEHIKIPTTIEAFTYQNDAAGNLTRSRHARLLDQGE